MDGQSIVGPDQTVRQTTSTADGFTLNGGILSLGAVELSGTIDVQDDSTVLRSSRPATGTTMLSGPIFGPGTLTLRNLSNQPTFISGANTYTGTTLVREGEFRTTNSDSLGSAVEGTTVLGGLLSVAVATAEPIRIEGGELRFGSGSAIPTTPITVVGGKTTIPPEDGRSLHVVLAEQGEGEIEFQQWSGGSSGIGSLRLSGGAVNGSLAHDGDLFIDSAELNVANTYTGDTVVRGRLTLNDPNGLGSGVSPIIVQDGGAVVLNAAPDGIREFRIESGELEVNTSSPINGGITLGGYSYLLGNGTFNGPIEYASSSIRAEIRGGTFNGTIRGPTRLWLGGGNGEDAILLNNENAIQGEVTIATEPGRSVMANHELALHLPSTRVSRGTLELNVPASQPPLITGWPGRDGTGTLRLNVEQSINDTWAIGDGMLDLAVDVKIDRILFTGEQGDLIGSQYPGIATASQGSLEIGKELLAIHSGTLTGNIRGSGQIRASGYALRIDADLSGFAGDIVAESGHVFLRSYGQPASGSIELHDGATVYGEKPITITNDITFHSDSDPLYQPVLSLDPSSTLSGRVDYSQGGATIHRGTQVNGALVGEDLTVQGGALILASPQDELAGTLLLDGGGLRIGPDATVPSLVEIKIQKQSTMTFEGSELSNRLSPSTLLRSQGGHIGVASSQNAAVVETISELYLESGDTRLITSSDHGGQTATLTVDTLKREKGAVFRLDEAGRESTTFIKSATSFDGVMLGAWATKDGEFLQRDASGLLTKLSPSSGNLATASPNDHVNMLATEVNLSADKTVASLTVGGTLDLGENQLIVASGGIRYAPNIVNGSITAGNGGPAELFLYRTNSVSANIVDNGEDAVGLVVVSPRQHLTLSGANSYSGGTWVVDDGSSSTKSLIIRSAAAIPPMDHVHIHGGDYLLSFDGTARLSELQLRNSGSLRTVDAELDADAMYLEDGLVRAALRGNGVIYKDTQGHVEFRDQASPRFRGDVVVRNGILQLEPDSLPQADFVLEGGRVGFDNDRDFVSNSFLLKGGTLSGNLLTGDVSVESDSTLYADEYTTLYGKLQGAGDLTIRGELPESYFDGHVGIFGDASQYTGNITVRSGSLRVGTPVAMGPGSIDVMPGGRLLLGADRGDFPATNISNTIHLRSASLVSTNPWTTGPSQRSPGEVSGDVFVHGEALIGATSLGLSRSGRLQPGLTMSGRVILDDDARVFSVGERSDNVPLIHIPGELAIGEDTAWNLTTASLAVTGTIQPVGDVGSIDFVGLESAVDFTLTKFLAQDGQTLTVTSNGQPPLFALLHSRGGITGAGKLVNDFELARGASIAPGDGTGKLNVLGAVIIGDAAVYEWDLLNTVGESGVDWDQLSVDGELSLQATTNAPWVISIQGNDGANLSQATSPWLIATAESITGFDSTAVSVDPNTLHETWPSLQPQQFAVTATDSEIYLSFVGVLGDCDGDQLLAASDLSCVGSIPERDQVLTTLKSLPGDLNGDRKVDFGDFVLLSANFGTTASAYSSGNIDLQGGIEFSDFLILAGNFGATSNVTPVPEIASHPTAIIGLCLGLAVLRRSTRTYAAVIH